MNLYSTSLKLTFKTKKVKNITVYKQQSETQTWEHRKILVLDQKELKDRSLWEEGMKSIINEIKEAVMRLCVAL